jgi:RND family efflux transporter MFP subunit
VSRSAKIVSLAAPVTAALIVLWAFAGPGRSGTGGASGDEGWAEVHREDLLLGVEVTGTLHAVHSVMLGPPQAADVWNFKISFLAPEGIEVRPGQPVVGFDTTELETTLGEKMGERDSAQKELEKKQSDLDIQRRDDALELAEAEARLRRASLKADVPSEVVAANDLKEARADLELAKKEIAYRKQRLALRARQGEAEIDDLIHKRDRAAARVRETREAMEQMVVPAPRVGTVVYVSVRGGEKKKVGDSCWRGDKVVEIPDLTEMKAVGEVDEADAGRLSPGQRVTLRLDAHPDVLFAGRVRSIRDSVETRSPNDPLKVVELEIALDRTDPQRMRPGMRFAGTVELERVPKALVVPAEAVFNRPGGPVVYRRSRWGTETVHPRLGRRNATRVEVLSGLAPGDRVSLHDPHDPHEPDNPDTRARKGS